MEVKMEHDIKGNIKGHIKGYLSGFLRAWLVGLLVLLQFSVIMALTFILQSYTVYFYGILEALSIVIIVTLVNANQSPSYKISWICIVLVLPISGHILYALWGKSSSKRKIEEKVLAKINHGNAFLKKNLLLEEEYKERYPSMARMSRYMDTENFPIFKNNEIVYFSMGEDVFEDIFKEMEHAEKFILIDFFIVAEGELCNRFQEILKRKVSQGVEVKFLYDDFGAMIRTSRAFWKRLESAGIETRVFNPIHKYTDKLYMNYRSHQKIIVIDGNIGYTGGINIADEYANIINRFGVWKDNAVKLTGDGVWGLTVTFLQMWEVASTGKFLDYNLYKPTKKFKETDVYCHVISDGPANHPRNPIENIYKQMIQYARKYLYIMTPYLIIEDDMKRTLITAVKSGIDVKIITPFIPDKKNVKILTNYNYGLLLRNGVKIYEYEPGFIHAKTIINEESAIVGTINMDYRSFYLHYECGVWMSNPEVNKVIKKDFKNTLKVCKEVTYEEWKDRPLFIKMYQPILNLFSTLM